MCSKDEQSPYLKCDISPGQCAVLEAAAGTGKTYNITNIVARIIMERADVTIDKMVIVTFTRAAAGELKFRISQRLAALEKESVVPDTQDELLLLAQQKGIDRAEIRKRLRLALLNFDRAMIGTIHSFAMRSLSENSFSSRLKFEFTLNESAPRIISELCNDFYRSICYENNIFKTCIKKDDLEKYCLKLIADPEIKIVWPEDISDTDITELLKQLKNKDQELINPPYGRKKALQTERGKIIAGIKKVIFERAYDDISKKYHAMCSEENFLGNDDLILKMCDALEDKNLVKQLQQTFPAGLIDEFQDTNNTQFKIFEKIFIDNPDSTFIVVGDPKQAIYRFRNCDIQTYIKAINLMKEKRNAQDFSMDINRRSGAKYIEVLNKIFESDNSFAMDGIKMPLQSAVADSKVLLEPDGQKEIDYPIQAAVDMEMPVDDIYYQCAADIYDFLNKKYLLPLDPPRPVAAGDIAILVNGAWKNAEKLRNALQKFNIPARRMKNANVFNTPEAVQLVSFLEGVLNYNDNDTLLRALITPLSDIALNAIKSEKIVAQRAGWMQELNELWHKRSFMIMFNELLIRFNVPDRLEDRSMSSFNTIADILGEEEFTRKLTPLALLNSLQKHISKAENDEKDNFPGSAETDQGAVIIDTIFGSKGLTYPVVFIPDLFYVSTTFNKDKIQKIFHNDAGELCFAPETDDTAQVSENDEMIQENLRKAYVAFTRAQYFCCFYYGDCSKIPRCSSLDWLFRKHGISKFSGLKKSLSEAAKSSPLDFPDLILQRSMVQPDNKGIECPKEILRRPDLMPYLVYLGGFLSFSSITPHGSSQSTLASDKDDEADDEGSSGNTVPEIRSAANQLPETMLLPSGTNFGNAVHKIMELCDFAADQAELTECTALQLRAHGIPGEAAVKHSVNMIYGILNAPIPDIDGSSFTLSQLDPAKKKSEFEFIYEFGNAFRTRDLFKFAAEYSNRKFGINSPDAAEESTTYDSGFFNGSIDLFFEHRGKFYIVDWKTNKLADMESYSARKLPQAMAGSRYYVQYMIYTAALFKYLRQRISETISDREFYNKYIGGTRYIFLRGVNESGHGIFSDRISYEEFRKLEEIIG